MSIILNDNLSIQAPKAADSRFGPYADTATALTSIVTANRFQGLVVGITIGGQVVEYWFRDGTADSNLILKVDNTANTANTLAQTAFNKANTANTLAQSAYDKANTANTLAQGAYDRANTANTLAQGAYDRANTKLSLEGGTIAGSLVIQNNLTVQGNVSYTGNVTSISVTGNTGQFFGYASNGFNALYAGIPTGYFLEPQIGFQVSSNYDGYAGINMQNINTGANASSDLFITADNGTVNDGFVDLGIGSSTYNYTGYSLIGKNDGYLFATGNTTTGGGNMIVGTGLNNDIVFSVGGINTSNEIGRFKYNTGLVLKQFPIKFADNTSQNTAAAPFAFSNSAFDKANTANTLAQTAFDKANTANTLAQAGFDKANTANTLAQGAFDKANSEIIGTAAFSKANVANTLAQGAYDRANTANTLAQGAYDKANTANTLAQGAYDRANTDFTNITITTGTYGNTTFVPVVTVAANGRVTNITNTAISFPVEPSLGVSGTYGNTTFVPVVTVAANGRIIAITNTAISNTLAQGAYDKANTANTLAQAGFDKANTANTLAQNAFDKGNTANTLAQTSFDKANTANTLAQNAFDKANTANTLAQTSFDKANVANTIAVSSYNQANIANTLAQSAFDKANTANTLAQGAYDRANTANTVATSSSIRSNSAITIAQAAYNQANTSYVSIVTNNFIAAGSNTFILSIPPLSSNNIIVNLDGITQLKSAYTLVGTNLSLSEIPSTGSSIDVTIFTNGSLDSAVAAIYQSGTAGQALVANTNNSIVWHNRVTKTSTSTAPTDAIEGDMWLDTSTGQWFMYIFADPINGVPASGWVEVGRP